MRTTSSTSWSFDILKRKLFKTWQLLFFNFTKVSVWRTIEYDINSPFRSNKQTMNAFSLHSPGLGERQSDGLPRGGLARVTVEPSFADYCKWSLFVWSWLPCVSDSSFYSQPIHSSLFVWSWLPCMSDSSFYSQPIHSSLFLWSWLPCMSDSSFYSQPMHSSLFVWSLLPCMSDSTFYSQHIQWSLFVWSWLPCMSDSSFYIQPIHSFLFRWSWLSYLSDSYF